MSPDLERLIQLQHLDSRIHEARQTIAAHPQRLAEADARLEHARLAVDAAKHRLKECQEARRVLEKDAAVYQGRLSKFKDQLASVKTNREYTAMQHEIATAEAELATAEEKVLERMMDADTIAMDVKEAETALAALQKELDGLKKELGEELAIAEASIAKASDARAELATALAPATLALFEQVAKARKGVALCSATRDGLCSVCHVRLRPQVFQKVRANDSLIQCDSCQRIMYYVPPPPPIEHPVVHTS
jgi:predicted  nucleic acid-binding Zn-ribbon protein